MFRTGCAPTDVRRGARMRRGLPRKGAGGSRRSPPHPEGEGGERSTRSPGLFAVVHTLLLTLFCGKVMGCVERSLSRNSNFSCLLKYRKFEETGVRSYRATTLRHILQPSKLRDVVSVNKTLTLNLREKKKNKKGHLVCILTERTFGPLRIRRSRGPKLNFD